VPGLRCENRWIWKTLGRVCHQYWKTAWDKSRNISCPKTKVHMEYLGTHSQPASHRFGVSCLAKGLFFKEPDHDEELKTNPAKKLRLSAGTHRLGKERISRWVSS
jgi:hypothetical protein